jgi:hypothetical protein
MSPPTLMPMRMIGSCFACASETELAEGGSGGVQERWIAASRSDEPGESRKCRVPEAAKPLAARNRASRE